MGILYLPYSTFFISFAVLIQVVVSQRALFVFGDSLVDMGNNNFINSIAKSNYFPYGIDINMQPTGRFSNGKTFVDIIAVGILGESGQHYGERYSLNQQVVNFETTLDQLRTMIGNDNLTSFLAKSVAVLVFGSNDYINNYLMPSIYSSSFNYNNLQFGNMLLNRYASQLLTLYNLGLRRMLIAGIGPLGCIPKQRAAGQAAPGRCVDSVNNVLGTFNEGLKSLVDQLNKRPGAVVAYGNTYGAVGEILNNPATYGFNVVERGCCGIGRNQGQITCLPFENPCTNRNQYVFWDAFHPTEAVNAILARRAIYGPPLDAYPFNIQQMNLIN
ncbi:GDSL esterase/lipase [Hibiscus syriacus]|uniref:GDSL esterase/lipase n=1 Tax=Hibiscus syriacus TaxID=106335 RepID=A0A6A3CTL6_HIBSY|nr:GDSL esterase/lipase [Hibiscus syriacus]